MAKNGIESLSATSQLVRYFEKYSDTIEFTVFGIRDFCQTIGEDFDYRGFERLIHVGHIVANPNGSFRRGDGLGIPVRTSLTT